jgi:hypothetical protein
LNIWGHLWGANFYVSTFFDPFPVGQIARSTRDRVSAPKTWGVEVPTFRIGARIILVEPAGGCQGESSEVRPVQVVQNVPTGHCSSSRSKRSTSTEARSRRSNRSKRSSRYRPGGSLFNGLKADARSNGSTSSPRAESPVQPLPIDFAGLRSGQALGSMPCGSLTGRLSIG